MKRLLFLLAPFFLIAWMPGCVTVQGGDKPIKVDITVTHKIDQQLDEFYSFEKKYQQPTTQPATQPADQMGSSS